MAISKTSWCPKGRRTRTRTRRRIGKTRGITSMLGCVSTTIPSTAMMHRLPTCQHPHPKSSMMESSTTLGQSRPSNGQTLLLNCVRHLMPTPRSFTTSSQASILMSSTQTTMANYPTRLPSNLKLRSMTSMMSQPLVKLTTKTLGCTMISRC